MKLVLLNFVALAIGLGVGVILYKSSHREQFPDIGDDSAIFIPVEKSLDKQPVETEAGGLAPSDGSGFRSIVDHGFIEIEPLHPFGPSGLPSNNLGKFLDLSQSGWRKLQAETRRISLKARSHRLAQLQVSRQENRVITYSPPDPTFAANLEKQLENTLKSLVGTDGWDFINQTDWGKGWIRILTDNLLSQSITYTISQNTDPRLPSNTVAIAQKNPDRQPVVSIRHYYQLSELSDSELRDVLSETDKLLQTQSTPER